MLPNIRNRWYDLHRQQIETQAQASDLAVMLNGATKFTRIALQSLMLGFGALLVLDGKLTATYRDGSNAEAGAVALAQFIAPQGLRQLGSSHWQPTGDSGLPQFGQPSTSHFGGLLSGAVERSNVDIAEELVGLITAQRNFQANAKAIDTATQLSQTIINLRN